MIVNNFNNQRMNKIQSQYENFAYNACSKIYGNHSYGDDDKCVYCGRKQIVTHVHNDIGKKLLDLDVDFVFDSNSIFTFVSYNYDTSNLTKVDINLDADSATISNIPLLVYVDNTSDKTNIIIKPAKAVEHIYADSIFTEAFYTPITGMTYNGLDLIDVSKVTTMIATFKDIGNANLNQITDWDVSNVTNMDSMFCGNTSLTDISALANWDVSNVTNFSYMFDASGVLDATCLENWKIKPGANISNMFPEGCTTPSWYKG